MSIADKIPKKITTIKLENETKGRLEHLREHEKESYDEIIKKMLYIINAFSKNPALGNRILRNIERIKRRKQVYEKRNKILIKKEQQSIIK